VSPTSSWPRSRPCTAYTRRDLSGYYSINARIHAAISAAAKNPVLAGVYSQVNARLQALRFRSNQDGEKWKRAVQEHEMMIEALVARDAAAMRDVLLAHLRNKRDTVLEQLRAAQEQQQPRAREVS
jgi:DNA-binding GntR family transcriptional regulator